MEKNISQIFYLHNIFILLLLLYLLVSGLAAEYLAREQSSWIFQFESSALKNTPAIFMSLTTPSLVLTVD